MEAFIIACPVLISRKINSLRSLTSRRACSLIKWLQCSCHPEVASIFLSLDFGLTVGLVLTKGMGPLELLRESQSPRGALCGNRGCFRTMHGSVSAYIYIYIHIYTKMKVQVTQSCPTLRDPMDSTVHGILQARILEWVAFPFSRGSFQPRDRTQFSRIAGRFFTSWATREALYYS